MNMSIDVKTLLEFYKRHQWRSFKDDPPPQTGVHLEGIDSRGLRDHFYWSLTNRRFQQEEFNKDAFNPDEIVWWTYALPEPKEGE